MTLSTVTRNLQYVLGVLQVVWVEQQEAQWSGIHSRNKPRFCACMAKQVETVERQHECTEPRNLTGSITHVTQHLEPFIGNYVNMGPLETTSNICCDMNGIEAMYCVLGLFVWCCFAVPSTVKIMHIRDTRWYNFYSPFPVSNHPLKFVGGLKTHTV